MMRYVRMVLNTASRVDRSTVNILRAENLGSPAASRSRWASRSRSHQSELSRAALLHQRGYTNIECNELPKHACCKKRLAVFPSPQPGCH
jgi:hypothetical protein